MRAAEATGEEAVSPGIWTIIISGQHTPPLGVSCPSSERLRGNRGLKKGARMR